MGNFAAPPVTCRCVDRRVARAGVNSVSIRPCRVPGLSSGSSLLDGHEQRHVVVFTIVKEDFRKHDSHLNSYYSANFLLIVFSYAMLKSCTVAIKTLTPDGARTHGPASLAGC